MDTSIFVQIGDFQVNGRQHQVGHIESVLFSRDGAQLFCSHPDRSIRVFDPNTWNARKIPLQSVYSAKTLCLGKEENHIVAATYGNDVLLVDWKRKEIIRTFRGHGKSVGAAAYLGNNMLATGSNDGTVRIWDMSLGKELKKLLNGRAEIIALSTSRDQKLLGCGTGDGAIFVFDITTGKSVLEVNGHQGGVVWSVGFTIDNSKLVSTSNDRLVKIWNIEKAICDFSLTGHEGSVLTQAIHKNGQILATGSSGDKKIIVWDLRNGKKQAEIILPEYPKSIAFSPDGRLLVAGGPNCQVFVVGSQNWKLEKTLLLE